MRVDAVNNNRQFYRFADFRGVDYSSSPLEVQSNRATDMANLILRDGTLHKRNGFEQLHYLDGTDEVKGAWLLDSAGEEILIYIQGQSVWEFNITKGEKSKNPLYTSDNKGITDIVTAAQLYKNGTRWLCIFCGEYLVYKGGKVHNILNIDSDLQWVYLYIPTTTKNITMNGSSKTEKKRVTFETINALSGWRYNELVVESISDSEEANKPDRVYILDGALSKGVEADYDGNAPSLIYNGIATHFGWDSENNRWVQRKNGYEDVENPAYITVADRYESRSKLVIPYPYNFSGEKNEIFPEKPKDDDVITIEFYDDTAGRDRINSIGNVFAIFGNDGRSDRVFIGDGNFVRYSENTADYMPDFTYFPVTNILRLGQSGNVTAMMRMANGTLAVFKDAENKQEPSVYYIAGKYIEVETDALGVTSYDDAFNVSAGNIEESCPTPNGIATLAGDSLFVSPSGVYGIELSGNVAADDRFARERSRIINTKLTKFDLTKAKAIVHDNRYYLAVGGEQNEVYVADARYKYTAEGDMSNTFNYEWFRWTDVPVASWLIKDNELWFISKDNYLCRFTDGYADKYLTSQGEETLKDKRVTFHPSLLPIVEKSLYAEYNNERYAIGNITKDENGYGFDIELAGEGVIELSFIVPVKAYWKSSVTALGSSIHRKNMYSLSVVVQPAKQSEVSVGYTTRLRDRVGMNAEGTNAFDFADISFEEYGGYQFFSFDAGGFISAYRQRVFERNFVYAQLFFACNSIGDCIVEEMSVEYTLTRKNIGVG